MIQLFQQFVEKEGHGNVERDDTTEILNVLMKKKKKMDGNDAEIGNNGDKDDSDKKRREH